MSLHVIDITFVKMWGFFSRRQNGGGGVMVWGAFYEFCVSILAILIGNQCIQHYIMTMDTYLIPFAEEHYSSRWIYQQDNWSTHRAMITKDWFKEEHVVFMPWPARSPDFNPIKNIWVVLARRAYKDMRQFQFVQDLTDCILDEWSELDRCYVYKLVQSMTKRCVQVLVKAGVKTEY